MKKLLALVLALVMTLSLCVVSSNAAYTDAADVELDEAVDVLSAIGVFQGSDGKFDPKANLTREQAAKLVAYLQIGEKAADALVGGGKFTDVAKDRWSAGYVDYCASIGIAAGVGDSKFDPTGSLTALQFGKMLLVCLGYDAKVEGMVGADWTINTSKLMTSAKLLRGLSDIKATDTITREQAAQMMLNAIRAPMVEYENKGSTISVNGATIEFGATKANYVTATVAEDSSVRNIGQGTLTNTGAYTVELGEKLYSNLKRTPLADGDDFGRPAHQWYLKATKIGTYSDTPDLSYTASTKLGTIYADLGLGKKIVAKDVTVYVDGVEDTTLEKDITKGDTDNKLGGNGVLLEVFYDDDNHSVVITLINTYAGEIVKTVAATASKDAYVVVATDGDAKPAGAAGTEDFETDASFEDDAVVYYTFSVKEDCVESVALCEKVEGTVTHCENKDTTKKQSKNVTIAGTKYDAAAKFAGVEIGDVSVDDDYIVYLDSYGYMIMIEEVEDISSDYALVLATAPHNTFVGDKAELVFADGTVKVVDTAKNYNAAPNEIKNNTIVTYKVNDDGEYVLKAAANVKHNVATDAKLAAYVVGETSDKYVDDFNMLSDRASIVVKTGNVVTANSATVFVVYDKTDDEWDTYTGIKNAPDVVAAEDEGVVATWATKSDTSKMVNIMYIIPEKDEIVSSNNAKTLFIAGESVSNLKHDKNSSWFEYDAVVDGKITTVKVDSTAVANANKQNGIFTSYKVDKYGVITNLIAIGTYNGTSDAKAGFAGVGIDKTSKDYTVILNTVAGAASTTITVADKAAIYYVDKDGAISESSYRAITVDENDVVFAVVKDYEVQELYICEVEAGATEVPVIKAGIVVDLTNPAAVGVSYTGTTAPELDDVLVAIEAALNNAGYTVTKKTIDAAGAYVFEAKNNKTGFVVEYEYTAPAAGTSARVEKQPTTAAEAKVIMNMSETGAYSKWYLLPTLGLKQEIKDGTIYQSGKVTAITAENFASYKAALDQWFGGATNLADFDAFKTAVDNDGTITVDKDKISNYGYVLTKVGTHNNVALVVELTDGATKTVVYAKQNDTSKDLGYADVVYHMVDISGLYFE